MSRPASPAVIFALLAAIPTAGTGQKGTAVPVPPQTPPDVVLVGPPVNPNDPNSPVLVQPVGPVPGLPGIILQAPPGGATARPPNGHFQLIARAFFVQHQTRDDLGENDGPGDEIMLRSDAFDFRSNGMMMREPPRRSGIIGAPDLWDIGGGNAVPVASARQETGGFITCDSHPRRPGPVSTGPNLPMIVWDGTLNAGSDGVIVVPSLWEMEDRGTSPAQTAWGTGLPISAANRTGEMMRIIRGPINAPIRANFLDPISVFDDGNRPIGASVHVAANTWGGQLAVGHARGMVPPSIVLTFDIANQIAARPAGATSFSCRPDQIVNDRIPLPPGAIVLQFRDPPGNEGDYLLILQLIRLS